jgi:hypothetical protein
MGLPSLREKIAYKLQSSVYTEESVLYIIVEIIKYIERSQPRRSLGDPDEMKVDETKFETIKFYRNWIVHPEKHSSDLSKEVLLELSGVRVGRDDEDHSLALEKLLGDEILAFCSDISITGIDVGHLNDGGFYESLKLILREQPIERIDGSRIGYDDTLRLTVL